MKKLIVFDLDGTLAESKASLDAEMATLLSTLLGIVKVAVISGGDWPQFEKQVLANLRTTNAWPIYLSFLPVEQSSTNTQGIGKSSIRKISPRLKKKRSSALSTRPSPQRAARSEKSGERSLKTGEARSRSPH